MNFIDLTGRKIKRLTVLRRIENRGNKITWECLCDCGNIRNIISDTLLQNKAFSCGCWKNQPAKHRLDLTGRRFGKLIVLKYADVFKYRTRWLCKCDCGNEKIISGKELQNKNTISCGCNKIRYGENNYNWNPNLTNEDRENSRKYLEYTNWHKLVFERDFYTCQLCKKKGGDLNIHHIKSYTKNKDLRTDLRNGVTLCKFHHIDFHKQYTMKNFTKEDFIEYLKAYNIEYDNGKYI